MRLGPIFRLWLGLVLAGLLLAGCTGSPRQDRNPGPIQGGILGDDGNDEDRTNPGEQIAQAIREVGGDRRVHVVLLGNIAVVGVERGRNLQAERSAPPSPDGDKFYVPAQGRTGVLSPRVVQGVRRQFPYIARIYSTDDPYLTRRIAEAAADVAAGRALEDLTSLARLAESLDGFGSRFPSDGEQRDTDENLQEGSPAPGQNTIPAPR